jgi:hypothetical protein
MKRPADVALWIVVAIIVSSSLSAGRFVADSNRDAMRAHLGVGLESS